jgi:hypothetical protein
MYNIAVKGNIKLKYLMIRVVVSLTKQVNNPPEIDLDAKRSSMTLLDYISDVLTFLKNKMLSPCKISGINFNLDYEDHNFTEE